jgi:hypothetical protein
MCEEQCCCIESAIFCLFRVSYRDGVMEHEPKACAAVKGTQIMVIFQIWLSKERGKRFSSVTFHVYV